MYLTFFLSLEERTLVSIAFTLWSQDDVRDLISKSVLQILHDNWQGIEKAVIEKSFKLQLPKTLQERLLNFIVRVGFQILSWIDFHLCHYNFVTELPATLVWTSVGTINNIWTAKLLVMGGTLDEDRSFALACMYCFEDDIKYYWNMFNFSLRRPKFECIYFVSYWINYMYKFDDKELLCIYNSDFMIPSASFILDAAENGNEAATRYFFNVNMDSYKFVKYSAKVVALKLCNLEKVTSLQRYSDIMLFLLSEMNVELQTNIIVNYTVAFLKCLLMWPWHNLFLEIAKDMWNSLSKKEYSDLLYSMIDLMRYEPNLHKLFGEFWQQSPEDYKLFITDEGNIVYLLLSLYKRGDENNVKLILNDSSMSIKENILKIESKPIFVFLVSSKKWDLIEFLIQECSSSREDLIRFRDVFKDHVAELLLENRFCVGGYSNFEFIEKCQWNMFFQLVDGCISRYIYKKRHIEDSTSFKKYLCKGIEKK